MQKKFEENKKKEELAELEAKYTVDVDKVDEDSESSEIEDDDGVLLSNKIETKFLDLLPKIITKDKSIYDPKTQFFTDEDGEKKRFF